VQVAHHRHDHHPPRLIAVGVVAAVLAATPAAHAAKPRFWALPSPLAPLSASPPLNGGAGSAGEGQPHSVSARTRIRIAIDDAGSPFALTATQRLDVRHIGDYSFRVSAPVRDVQAAPGSATVPGLRSGAILWEGFNPGHRILAARLELDPGAAASLPLRVEIAGGRVTLRNVTSVGLSVFSADALAAPLRTYLSALRKAAERGESPQGGGALVTSQLERRQIRVSAPLAVRGTVGGRRVDLILGGAAHPLTASFPQGRVQLTVTSEPPTELLAPGPSESGRLLLDRAIRASLEFARARQYDSFLGNPDPIGATRATYVYVSSHRAAPAPPTPAAAGGHNALRTIVTVLLALGAAAVAATAWARS
jgi:hypothetical protein